MFFEKLAGDNKNSVKSPPYCTVAVVHSYQRWKLVEPWIRSEAFSRLKYEQSANCQIPSNLYFEHVGWSASGSAASSTRILQRLQI